MAPVSEDALVTSVFVSHDAKSVTSPSWTRNAQRTHLMGTGGTHLDKVHCTARGKIHPETSFGAMVWWEFPNLVIGGSLVGVWNGWGYGIAFFRANFGA